jgi:tetratricopeptide (TPR) repeat protein
MIDSGVPTALVSWAHRDPNWSDRQAEEWIRNVVKFGTLLRLNGVDADLDLWNENDPYIDWTRWGQLEVQKRELVIIVASAAWRQRWEGTNSPKLGAGAVSEADALKGLFNNDQSDFQSRAIIALLPGLGVESIPPDLHRLRRFQVKSLDEAGMEPLLRTIHRRPLHKKPELGKVPALPSISYLTTPDSPGAEDIATKRGELDEVQSGVPSPEGDVPTLQAPFDRPPLLEIATADHGPDVGETAAEQTPTMPDVDTTDDEALVALRKLNKDPERNTGKALKTDQALTILRRKADDNPARHGAGLAAALNTRISALKREGRFDEALEISDEALTILRRQADDDMEQYLPSLTAAVDTRIGLHNKQGRGDKALKASTEMVMFLRSKAEEDLERYLPSLITAVDKRIGLLNEEDRADEALMASTEMVMFLRSKAEEDLERYLPSLITAVSKRIGLLNEEDRADEALMASTEMVMFLRRMAEEDHEKYLPSLITAIGTRIGILNEQGRADEALEAEFFKLKARLSKLNETSGS